MVAPTSPAFPIVVLYETFPPASRRAVEHLYHEPGKQLTFLFGGELLPSSFVDLRQRHVYFPWEQSNMTPKRAEHCSEAHRPHMPVMRVLQSVSFSLNWQVVTPPLEMLLQGRVVPGKWATTQPCGTGTLQLCLASSLAMPKLQENSVVAVESPSGEATERSSRSKPSANPSITADALSGMRNHLAIGVAHRTTLPRLAANGGGG